MTFSYDPHYALEIARGNVPGQSHVNKFGRATDVDSGIATDVWDRANATDAQRIWVAPTTARIHAIVSNNAADAYPAGAGARTIRVYGLTAWNAAEVSEDIQLNGVTSVNTVNSYVIIHRMKVLTKGATNVNVGVITATAATDATITAQINAGEGQTQMAIYGVPSTQIAYITNYYFSAIKASIALSVALTLLANTSPDVELLNYLTKNTLGIVTDGSNFLERRFNPYFVLPGPAILKLQGNASLNNTDVSAGFDLILVDN